MNVQLRCIKQRITKTALKTPIFYVDVKLSKLFGVERVRPHAADFARKLSRANCLQRNYRSRTLCQCVMTQIVRCFFCSVCFLSPIEGARWKSMKVDKNFDINVKVRCTRSRSCSEIFDFFMEREREREKKIKKLGIIKIFNTFNNILLFNSLNLYF